MLKIFKRKKKDDTRFRLIEAEVQAAAAAPEADDALNAARIAEKYGIEAVPTERYIEVKRSVARVKQLNGARHVYAVFDNGQRFFVGSYATKTNGALRWAKGDIENMLSSVPEHPLNKVSYSLIAKIGEDEAKAPLLVEAIHSFRG